MGIKAMTIQGSGLLPPDPDPDEERDWLNVTSSGIRVRFEVAHPEAGDPDRTGAIRFEILTDEVHTKRITPRQGREHLYPVMVLATQTFSADQVETLAKYLQEQLPILRSLEAGHTYHGVNPELPATLQSGDTVTFTHTVEISLDE